MIKSYELYKSLPSSARHTMRLDIWASAFQGALFGVLPLSGYVALKSLDCTRWQLATIKAAPQAALLFAIFWSTMVRDRPKMPWVFWPSLLSRGLLVLLIWWHSAAGFTIIITLCYFFYSMILPAQTGILRSNYPTAKRGEIVATVRVGLFALASVAAYFAGVWLDADFNSFVWIFAGSGALGVVAAIIYRGIDVRGEEHLAQNSEANGKTDNEEGAAGPLDLLSYHGLLQRFFGNFYTSVADLTRVLRHDVRFRSYMIAYMLFGFGNLMVAPLYDIFLKEELNVSYLQSTFIFSVLPQVMVIVSTTFWGRLLDRQNLFLSRTLFTLMWAVEPVSYALANHVEWIYAAKIIVGVGMGGSTLIWLLGAMNFASKEEVPLYMGIHTTLTGVRGLLAPFVGVQLIPWLGLRGVFWLGAAMMLTSALLTGVMGKRETQAEKSLAPIEQKPSRWN
ncbi:MAG: MFS transporter [bacterium]